MSGRGDAIDMLLGRFPKRRPALPGEYQRIFEDAYVANRSGGSASARLTLWLERWMHRRVARPMAGGPGFPLLELGAGTLNHVEHEPREGLYDAVEPMEALHRDSPARARLHALYRSIDDVPVEARYRRIVSVAVLEHVLDLPALLARSALLLAPGGEFRAGIPTEGGLLWYLAWRFGTGLAFRLRYGLDYAPFMRSEHVNTADEIVALVSHLFGRVQVARFPLPLKHLSFYTSIVASEPDLARARALLAAA